VLFSWVACFTCKVSEEIKHTRDIIKQRPGSQETRLEFGLLLIKNYPTQKVVYLKKKHFKNG